MNDKIVNCEKYNCIILTVFVLFLKKNVEAKMESGKDD